MRRGRWQRTPRVGPSDLPSDVQDEVENHLALQIADLVAAGWDAGKAREEAVRRFGDRRRIEREMLWIDRQREGAMRRTRVLADMGQDIKLGFRQLRSRPVSAAVAIVILALGIGASTAAFAVVDGALLRPLPFPDAHELIYIQDVQRGGGGYPASLPEFRDWERDADFLVSTAAVTSNQYTLTGDGDPELITARVVTGDPLGALRVAPVIGRGFTTEEIRTAQRLVMLDEGFWRSRYAGRRDVIGQTLRLNDEAYTVIGVMPHAANVLNGGRPLELWLPLQEQEWMSRGLHFMGVVGRLQPGLTMEAAHARAQLLAHNLQQLNSSTHGIALNDIRSELVGETRTLLLLLLGASGFLLLIVCANLANLFLAQSLGRTREFAVRVALGAGWFRLVRQVVTEGVVLALMGGALGVGVAFAASRIVASVSLPVQALAPRSPLDARVLAFTALTSLLVAVLFAVWPAVRTAATSVASALKEAGDARALAGRGRSRRRRLLVAVEVALSLVLLTGAGLLVRSLMQLLQERKGFDAANVLTFTISLQGNRYQEAGQARFFDELLARISALPGVLGAAATNHLPLGRGDTNGGFEIGGVTYADQDPRPYAKKRVVSPAYFESLGIPVLSGRSFVQEDRQGAPDVVVISEAVAARYWPGENPVGKRMRYNWGPGDVQEIVGVVGDVKHDGLDQPVEPMIYRPVAQFPMPGLSIIVKTRAEPLDQIAAIRKQLAELDASLPIAEVGTLESVVSASLSSRRTFMLLLAGVATIALLVATVGVYAITAQSVAQRTREIGVRMAIGAERRDVLRLVLREELTAIAGGLIVGVLGALATTRLLRTSLYQVSPTDPLTFVGVSALLLFVAVLACCLPAMRAARLDPVRALRME
jgi:predicted permease